VRNLKWWLVVLSPAACILTVAMVWYFADASSFADACHRASGHLYERGIELCVTDDGRLVEIVR